MRCPTTVNATARWSTRGRRCANRPKRFRDARTRRDNAASATAAALAAATDSAPTAPPFLQRWGSNFADVDAAFAYAKQNFTSGLLTSLTGIGGFVRSVNPGDIYNATHPGEYLARVSDMAAGMVVAAADPGATVGALWDGVKDNPAEALGALTGDAVLTLATGGAGVAKPALSALERVDDIADAGRVVERIDGASPPRLPDRADTPSSSAESAHQTPSPRAAPEPAHTTSDTASRANEPVQGASPTSADRPGDQGGPSSQPESTRSSDDNEVPPRTDPESGHPTATHPDNGAPATTPETHGPEHGEPGPGHAGSDPDAADPPGPHHDSDDTPTAPASGGEHTPGNHHDADGPAVRNDIDQGRHGSGSVGDEAMDNPPEHTATDRQTDKTGDPVATATGEFLLPLVDLTLPGVLPLTIKRGHRSNYRFGRWFGPSWSSTLDMRVVVEASCVTVVFDDGMLLPYPHDEVGVGVEPITGGQRWTLTRTEAGGYRLWDPASEMTWHFAPDPVLDGVDTGLGNYAVSAITDRHHNRIRFHYDSTGAPTEVTHSGGYRVVFGTEAGRITTMAVVGRTGEDPSRTVIRRFGYTAGDLTEVVNGVGGRTRFTYDEQHRITSWIDSNTSSVVNTYDDHGRVIRQRGTDGVFDADFDYTEFPDGTGRLTTVTNSRGATTAYGFDNDLRLRDIAAPDGGRRRITYNADRKPLTVTEPDGGTTGYRYTPDGNVAAITRPDGSGIRIDYAHPNRPAAITNADGTVRRQSWDAAGNLVATVDEAGARTVYDHHPCGAVGEVRTDDVNRTVIDVDAAGLPISVIDVYGAVTRIERDHFGRPITVTGPVGAITRYDWTAEGKPAQRVDPDGFGESWTYDGENNLLTHTNRAGFVTSYSYGRFDKVSARTDPDGSVHRYLHDTERRLTAVINPLGQRWTYEYDTAGRLAAETDYTGATTRYTHNRLGRIASVTSATGVTRHHRYDILGNLTSITADSGEFLSYTHDPAGRVLTAVNGVDDAVTHTLEFTYTPTGQVATQTLDDQPPLVHEHDVRGRRTRRTSPSGAVTTWSHDLLGRTTGLDADGHSITFSHDHAGRLDGWRIGEVQVDRSFTPTGELAGQQVTGFPAAYLNLNFGDTPVRPAPFSIRRDDYAYRPDGFLSAATGVVGDESPVHTAYHLDPAGRISAITRDEALVEAYEYDALSNITAGLPHINDDLHAPEVPDRMEGREYHNNLLVRDGRNRYFYDPAGRLIRKVTTHLSRKPDVWHYRYNAFDQLTDVSTPDGQWWCYCYDALGRRVEKFRIRTREHSAIAATTFLRDGQRTIEEFNPISSTTTRWFYRPGSFTAILQIRDTENYPPAFVAMIECRPGEISELIEPASCAIRGWSQTNIWGRTNWTGPESTPVRMPGQYYDHESGYHYNLFRIYNPEIGRYITSDPLGLIPSANPAAYPRNPSRWSDPLGLAPDVYSGNTDGGSWDPAEEPYLYRGVPCQTHLDPGEYQKMYQNALEGIAEPRGGVASANRHAGGNTESPFVSWTTDYEGVALAESQTRNGPGVVMRIPNADGISYQRVSGITYSYPEDEVTILGTITGADVSVGGGPWRSTT